MVTAIEKAQALYDAYVEGPWGMQDLSDYEGMIDDGIVDNDEEYFFLANMLNDGKFSDAEAETLRSWYPNTFVNAVRDRWTSSFGAGKKASEARSDFLAKAVVDDGYSEPTRAAMLREAARFGYLPMTESDRKAKLVPYLRSDNIGLRMATLAALSLRSSYHGSCSDGLDLTSNIKEEMYPALAGTDPAVREKECDAILQLAEETENHCLKSELYDLVLSSFSSFDPDLRRSAITAAFKRSDSKTIRIACDNFNAAFSFDLDAVADKLILAHSEKLLPVLTDDFGCTDDKMLGKLLAAKDVAFVVKVATSKEKSGNEVARNIVVNYKDAAKRGEAKAITKALLSGSDTDVRCYAMVLWAGLRGKEAVLELGEMMTSDPSEWVRRTALHLICTLGVDSAPEFIKKALDDPNEDVRLAALGQIVPDREGDNKERKRIFGMVGDRLLRDVSKTVRFQTAEKVLTFSFLGDDIFGWLDKAFDDPDATVRDVVLGRLKELAEDRRSKERALPCLIRAARVKDPDLAWRLWNIVKGNYLPKVYLPHLVAACNDGDFDRCHEVGGALEALPYGDRWLESAKLFGSENLYLHFIGGKMLYESAVQLRDAEWFKFLFGHVA